MAQSFPYDYGSLILQNKPVLGFLNGLAHFEFAFGDHDDFT
jgi:hypothetical protein